MRRPAYGRANPIRGALAGTAGVIVTVATLSYETGPAGARRHLPPPLARRRVAPAAEPLARRGAAVDRDHRAERVRAAVHQVDLDDRAPAHRVDVRVQRGAKVLGIEHGVTCGESRW